jgi:hypothetical protein
VTFPIAKPLDPMGAWREVVPDAGGGRILTLDGGVRLRDGASGELVATLAEGDGRPSVLFLVDGRIVVGRGSKEGEVSLEVFERTGVRVREMAVDLGPGGPNVGPEVAPGQVAVSSFRAPFLPEDTLVVDVGEGRVVERLAGLVPISGFFWNVWAVPPDARPTSVHFFRDVDGRVVRIDFATRERKVVAGPGAPRGERISLR